MAFIRHALESMFGDDVGETMFGSESKLKKFETLSHSQKKLVERLLQNKLPNLPSAKNNPLYQQGSSYIQQLLSQQPQERYAQLEAPYMRQFNEQIMPGIAEQYAGAGALGSSGFQNAAGGASADLMERLASLNLNQQNIFRGQQLGAVNQAQNYAMQPFNEAMQGRQLQLARYGLGLGTPAFGYQNMPAQQGFIRQGMETAGKIGMAALPFLL